MKVSSRIYGLDVLRAIAIILVVISHSKPIIFGFLSHEYEIYLRHLGLFGVEIFFILSGFLIGNILIDEILNQNFTLKVLHNFWIKRWFRTLPLYVFFLLVNLVLYFYLHKELKIEFLSFFFFFQNFSHAPIASFMPEAWSLSVEEWFYIITPIVFYASIKIFSPKYPKDKIIFYSIISLLFIITINRWIQIEQHNLEFGEMVRKVVIFRLDALLYGVLLAYIFKKHHDFLQKYKNIFFIVGMFIFCYFYFSLMNGLALTHAIKAFFFTFLDISFGFILIKFYFIKKEDSGFSIFSYIALISYSIYLSHLIIIETILRYVSHTTSIKTFNGFFLSLIVILLVSSLTYRYIELPFLRLRKKYLQK